MADNQSNEIWVFLSHSNKDYEKVRQVRNLLEEQSLRPLMFFLHCLSDDDEIDSLIKREIDCRTRFILCDSENARKSHWVQKEVEYIKSQNRICETIDLSMDINEIFAHLQEFINKTKIFISYNREQLQLAKSVYERLLQYDFSVYIDTFWDFNNNYHQNYDDALRFLEDSVVKTNGYVVAIMNERILSESSSSRYEITKAIHDNKSLGKEAPNIIPFVTQDSILHLIEKDEELSPLVACNIQSLECVDKVQRSDEILKRIVSQLMTLGSIKVQAENFCRQSKVKEARFLYGLLLKNDNDSILTSESGLFFVNVDGIAQRFEPSEDNPFEDDVSDSQESKISKSIRTLIIPEGVKGFVSDFMRGVKVLERFELPEGLLSIGNNSFDIMNEENCVFADCALPAVVIPQSVRTIGNYAFGHTHIESLQLPASLRSPYGRQFKDSYIGTLRLPKEWERFIFLDEGRLKISNAIHHEEFGYLLWYSTRVKELLFYE